MTFEERLPVDNVVTLRVDEGDAAAVTDDAVIIAAWNDLSRTTADRLERRDAAVHAFRMSIRFGGEVGLLEAKAAHQRKVNSLVTDRGRGEDTQQAE